MEGCLQDCSCVIEFCLVYSSSTTCEKQYFDHLIQLFPDNEDNRETRSSLSITFH